MHVQDPQLEQSYFDLWMNSSQSWGMVKLIEEYRDMERQASKSFGNGSMLANSSCTISPRWWWQR